jgi:1,4-alpha-glucan branching enzyme
LKKSYLKNGSCRAAFSLPAGMDAKTAYLCGTFNDWDKAALPIKRLKDGSFSMTIALKPGEYSFSYNLDGYRWEK